MIQASKYIYNFAQGFQSLCILYTLEDAIAISHSNNFHKFLLSECPSANLLSSDPCELYYSGANIPCPCRHQLQTSAAERVPRCYDSCASNRRDFLQAYTLQGRPKSMNYLLITKDEKGQKT